MTLERNLVLIFGSNVQPGVAMTPHKMLRGPATLTTKCSAEYGCAFGTMQERIGLFRIGMLRQGGRDALRPNLDRLTVGVDLGDRATGVKFKDGR